MTEKQLCEQCGERPVLARLEDESGTLVCLDCWAKVEEIRHNQLQQAMGLAAIGDYFAQHIPYSAGLGPAPQLRWPQQPATIQMTSPTFNNLKIDKSQVGVLNTGELSGLRDVDITVSKLSGSGHDHVAEALREIAQAILEADEDDLRNVEREELVEVLAVLGNFAQQPKQNRGVVKSLISTLKSTLTAAGNLASVWEAWGSALLKHFGLSV